MVPQLWTERNLIFEKPQASWYAAYKHYQHDGETHKWTQIEGILKQKGNAMWTGFSLRDFTKGFQNQILERALWKLRDKLANLYDRRADPGNIFVGKPGNFPEYVLAVLRKETFTAFNRAANELLQ